MALIGAAFGIGFCFGPLLGAGFLPAEPERVAARASNTLTSETAPSDVPADESGAPVLKRPSAAPDSDEGTEDTERSHTPDPNPPSAVPGYLAGILSGLATLSAIFLLPESLRPGSRAEDRHWLDVSSLKQAVSRPVIGLILLTIFLTTIAFGQFETTLALLTKRLGLPDRKNYLVFAYIGFVLALSQGMIVRRLLPKLGEPVMSRAGTMVMTLGLVLIGVSAYAQSRTLLYWVIPIAVVGFSAVTPSLQSLLSRHSAATQQGGILGLGQSISALSRILGPAMGVPLNGVDVSLPYWVGAGIMALSVILTMALNRPEDAPVTPPV
jgi:hypothetical protein